MAKKTSTAAKGTAAAGWHWRLASAFAPPGGTGVSPVYSRWRKSHDVRYLLELF